MVGPLGRPGVALAVALGVARPVLAVADPGRGDQDVDGAEGLDRGIDHGPVGVRVGRLQLDEVGPPSGGHDLGRRGLPVIHLEVGDDDAGPLPAEPVGAGPADAVAAPGDDGHVVLQASAHWSAP